MELSDALLSIFLPVLQAMTLVAIGIGLSLFGVVKDSNFKAINQMHYHILFSSSSFIGVLNSVNILSPQTFLMVTLAIIISYAASFMLSLLLSLIFNVDLRTRGIFIMVATIGNIYAMPGTIIEFSCVRGGFLFESGLAAMCKASNNGWAFTNCTIAWLNLTNWIIAMPLINMDKNIALELKGMLHNILLFYPSVNAFLANSESKSLLGIHQAIPCKSMNELVTQEFYKLHCTSDLLKRIKERHKALLQSASSINKEFKITQFHTQKTTLTMGFKLLLEVPMVFTLSGLVCALIIPLRSFVFSDQGYFNMMLTMLYKVSTMSVPLSLVLLGCKLCLTFQEGEASVVKKKDIMLMCAIKQFIMPCIGLLILSEMMRMSDAISSSLFAKYLIYLVSAAPSSLALILACAKAEYGTVECALLLFWQYVICFLPLVFGIFSWYVIFVQ